MYGVLWRYLCADRVSRKQQGRRVPALPPGGGRNLRLTGRGSSWGYVVAATHRLRFHHGGDVEPGEPALLLLLDWHLSGAGGGGGGQSCGARHRGGSGHYTRIGGVGWVGGGGVHVGVQCCLGRINGTLR